MLFAPHSPVMALSEPDEVTLAPSHRLSKRQKVDWQGTMLLSGDQREDSFAIGPDGCVWNLVQMPGAQPQLLPTGLKADSFAVGRDEAGLLVVFAAHGLHVQAAVQQPQACADRLRRHWNPKASSLWSAPVSLTLPPMEHAVSLVRIVCTGRGESLHLGAVVQCQRPRMAEHFELVVTHWPRDHIQLRRHELPGQAWSNSWKELLAELDRLPDDTQAKMSFAGRMGSL
jgi:hypothetical protein